MPVQTESVSSVADLIGKLDTYLATQGWTAEHLDTSTTAGTGGEWAMRRATASGYIRFSASWDAANSGTGLSLYHYVDQNYDNSDRPWEQDHDSGNGFAGTTPDSSIKADRHVDLGSPSVTGPSPETTMPTSLSRLLRMSMPTLGSES